MSRPPRAPAPTPVPLIGTLDQKLAQLVNAISEKANNTLEPTYHAVLLMAPDGSTWRVTINAAGALVTAQVPRT
jgi:hypothetical protein